MACLERRAVYVDSDDLPYKFAGARGETRHRLANGATTKEQE